MPRITLRALLTLLAVATAVPVSAQDTPLMLDLDGGVAVPVSSFADGTGAGEGAAPGAVFEAGFVLPRSDRFAVLLGFRQERFGCEDAGCGPDGRYVATGFDLGLRLALRSGAHVVPWLSVEGVTTRVETDALPAPDAGVSKLGWGVRAGAGLWLGGSWIAVQPKVSFTAVDTDLPGGATLGLRYVTATLGASFPF